MKIKLLYAAVVVLVLGLFAFPVYADSPVYTEPSDILESRGTVKLQVGQQENLSTLMLDYDTDTQTSPAGTRIWTSANPDKVAVDANGVVTAKKLGTVKITVAYHDNRATSIVRTVRVEVVPEKTSKPAGNLLTIEEDAELNVLALLFPGLSEQDGKAVVWTVKREYVAAVDSKGILTAQAYGTTKVTAVCTDRDGNATQKQMTVKVVSKHTKVLGTNTVVLAPGEKLDIVQVLYPNYTGPSQHIRCTSSDHSVAAIGGDNRIVAKGSGDCKVNVVYAVDKDGEQQCTIQVRVA